MPDTLTKTFSGYGWFIVLGGAISQFLVFGYGRSFGVFYARFIEQFQKSAAETAWIGALYQFSSQILGIYLYYIVSKLKFEDV